MRRLRDHGLVVRPHKCTFACDEMEFLGVVVGKGGARPDDSKIKVGARVANTRERSITSEPFLGSQISTGGLYQSLLLWPDQ